jgi:hypothetical protein
MIKTYITITTMILRNIPADTNRKSEILNPKPVSEVERNTGKHRYSLA